MKFSDLGITVEDLEGIWYEDGMDSDFDDDNPDSKFSYLSQGANSVVFNIKDCPSCVLKLVMYDNDPFIELMKLSEEDRELCSLPVLYDKYENEGLYLYLIERCYDAKFSPLEYQDMFGIPYCFEEVRSSRLNLLESSCNKLTELFSNKINQNEEYVSPLGEVVWDWDIYDDNILMRKNGELVLVDPFCAG